MIALIVAVALHTAQVLAQAEPRTGVVADGDAVVTGFSGAQVAGSLAPGADPAAKTYIDLAGLSARVVDLRPPGVPAQAQLWPAAKPFSVTAGQVGQVFAVALDNAAPPNIYLAATSAYGLPIVVADKDGDGLPDRAKVGGPGARFMPGLFGPATSGGGPGSIWRVDGRTGDVRLFATVRLDGEPNPGPGLGGLAFDPVSGNLFVADRATGMIHRFDSGGRDRGRFDHGTKGRAAAKLPSVTYDSGNRLDIRSADFKSENPATWGYAPRPRLIFGLAVRDGRLYYAVADKLQVWSISLGQDGAFGGDPRLEITVPPSYGATEIARITFDDQGRMLLATRGAPTGAFDFTELAQEGVGRVLRYQRAIPPGPPGPVWQPVPQEYAIGFASQLRNGNGGVAVGYRYTADGARRAGCDGYVWSTGEQLRVSPDQELAARLAQGGPTIVDGLQGNDAELVAPANVPPLQSYFIDYDDRFQDPAARGHLGDIAIWRLCGRALLPLPQSFRRWSQLRPPGLPGGPGFFVPPPTLTFCPQPGPSSCQCPPGGDCACPPGTTKQPGFQCCPLLWAPGPDGQCKPLCPGAGNDPQNLELCGMGFGPADPNDPIKNPQDLGKLTCLDGSKPKLDAQGNFYCPSLWSQTKDCPSGFALDGSGQCVTTAKLEACNKGNQSGVIKQIGIDGSCQTLCSNGSWAFPTTQCCPVGSAPGPDGKCGPPPPPPACPPGQATSKGFCCPQGTAPQPDGMCAPAICHQGQTMLPTGCCADGQVTSSGKCCPMGSSPQANGECLPPAKTCPPELFNPITGACLPPSPCPSGWLKKQNGMCCPPPGAVGAGTAAMCKCPPGQNFNGQVCTSDAAPKPTPGGSPILLPKPAGCFPGFIELPSGQCCLRSQVTAGQRCCPAGQKPDEQGRDCVAAAPTPGFVPGTGRLPIVVPVPGRIVPQPDRDRVVSPPRKELIAPLPKKEVIVPLPKKDRIVQPPPEKKRIVVPPKRKEIVQPKTTPKRLGPPLKKKTVTQPR